MKKKYILDLVEYYKGLKRNNHSMLQALRDQKSEDAKAIARIARTITRLDRTLVLLNEALIVANTKSTLASIANIDMAEAESRIMAYYATDPAPHPNETMEQYHKRIEEERAWAGRK